MLPRVCPSVPDKGYHHSPQRTELSFCLILDDRGLGKSGSYSESCTWVVEIR